MTNGLTIRNLSPLAYAMTRIGSKLFGSQVGEVIFSPGQPLQPVTTEQQPRQFQYPVAVNMAQQPRRDYPDLTPFEVLRYLCKKHPLAALCIRVRSEQIAMLPGNVVAKRKREQASVQRDCDALDLFFAKPDRRTLRPAWLQMLMRDLLEIDAPAIYRQPSRGGGLYGLELVDGATIKPLLDDRGRTMAYQQVIYGLALSQYLGRNVGPDEEKVLDEWAPGELLYQPYNPQSTSPYGRAPMEDMLTQAQIYLQKQGYDLSHFTEGNVPAALGVFNSETLNVQQVLDFEANFNTVLQGDLSRGSKIKFIPFPMKVERLQELSEGGRYESAWEEFMVKLVCAFYGVTPAEIGFTADVNRATSEGQENIQYRRGFGPITQWLKLVVFDPVIQQDFGRPDLEWAWNYGESEDKLRTAQIDQIYAGLGTVSGAELRSTRYPDFEGPAPTPPQAPAGAEGAPQLQRLAKAAGDVPADEAERLAAEAAATTLLAGLFAAQLSRLRRVLRESQGSTAPLGAFWEAETAELVRGLLPFWDETLTTAAAAGVEQLAIGTDWGLVNQNVLKLAREEATRLAQQLNNTSRAQAATIIEDWIATGGSMDDLIDRLAIIYPERRAKMVAVTEVTRLYALGNHAAWAASSVVGGYEWHTTEDDRVCPICKPLEGSEYPMEDTEHLPPAHVMCRCWITPVVKSLMDL